MDCQRRRAGLFVELPQKRARRRIVERLPRPVEKPVENNHHAYARNPARKENARAENPQADDYHVFSFKEVARKARKRSANAVCQREDSADNPHLDGINPECPLNLR